MASEKVNALIEEIKAMSVLNAEFVCRRGFCNRQPPLL